MMSTRSAFLKCLLLAVVISCATSFVTKPAVAITKAPAFVATESKPLTSLQLRIDPKELEKNNSNNAAANMKGAAYGGSIAIAVLLPVVFLVWAASH